MAQIRRDNQAVGEIQLPSSKIDGLHPIRCI